MKNISIICVNMACQNTKMQLPNGSCDSGLNPQQRPPVLLTPLPCVVRYTAALLSLVLPHHFFFLSAAERRGTGGGVQTMSWAGLGFAFSLLCALPSSIPLLMAQWTHTNTHTTVHSVFYTSAELKRDVLVKAMSTTATVKNFIQTWGLQIVTVYSS